MTPSDRPQNVDLSFEKKIGKIYFEENKITEEAGEKINFYFQKLRQRNYNISKAWKFQVEN